VINIFTYNICNIPDEDLFNKQCGALEKNIKDLKKDKLLIDVDESKIQIYYYDNKKIKVVNDYYVNALYIESEVELKQFF